MNKEQNSTIYDPNYVKNIFDRMSNSYEKINLIFSFGFTQIWRKAMMKKLTISDSRDIEIIDLMTGMGETWDLIKQVYPNSLLSGLDISEGMLSLAKKKNRKKYNDEIIIKKDNVLENNLESNKYDIVISAFGLKTFNTKQIVQLASEVHRILKPGGEFVFIEISSPNNWFLNQFFKFYLGIITPMITKILLNDAPEYKMLWEYTRNFKSAQSASNTFNASGLNTSFDSYFFGCATGIHGFKEKE